MKSLAYLSVLAVLVFTLSTFAVPDAHATGGTISGFVSCLAIGGTWNGVSTCTVTSLSINSGETLTINPGVTLNINSGSQVLVFAGGTLDNQGEIENSGTIGIDGGNITNSHIINNNSGGTITTNAGSTMTNSGIINNFSGGTITIDSGGYIINGGDILNNSHITNFSGGTITNNSGGTITNNSGGTINNNSGGTILNNSQITNNSGGIITNNSGGTITNSGNISNAGTMANAGNITNFGTIITSGTITNSGRIDNYSGITNSGTFANSGTIIIYSSGGITNNSGGIITNNPGVGIHNDGGITNNSGGTINNSGFISANPGGSFIANSGTININSGGDITFNGGSTLSNSGNIAINYNGDLVTAGTFTNNSGGTITNNSGGTITNDATITNNSGGTITNNSGGNFLNSDLGGTTNNSGTITNSGFINNSGGTLTNNSGGTFTNNSGGTIINDVTEFNSGNITNNGGFTNNGNVTNLNGTVLSNAGTITNAVGIITNKGTITNSHIININSGGTITNSHIINNNSGGKITNKLGGTITNNSGGTITNKGTITNTGTLNNSGTINLNTGDTITFSGPSTYSGSFTNSGTLNMNSGSIIAIGSGTKLVISTGTLTIPAGARLDVNSGSILTINSGATLTNNGTITVHSGGTINNFGTIHNLGTINNSGTINNQCGSVYTGTLPVGNPINHIACISINDVSLTEGNNGTKNFNFTVTRTGNTTGVSSVNFATADNTATIANSDYISKNGTLSFTAGQTTKTVTILVKGDTILESNETFNVNLSVCTGCAITDNQGVGTILNDDMFPIIIMNDTTVSSGFATHSGVQINAEFASGTSQLLGKPIDTITLKLRKSGSPTGMAQVGVFNTDLTVRKLFGTKDVSTLTGSYADYSFTIPGQPYTISSGDKIGIKFTGGNASNSVAVMRDTNPADPFDGTNSYYTYHDTIWRNATANDLYMILQQTHPAPLPIILMNDTTASSGLSLYSARQIHAEFANGTSQLIGDKIDTMTLKLRKTGSPTGMAQVGIFNSDLTVKKLFGTKDVATLTGSYADYSFTIPSEYVISSGDRMGIKFTGGNATNYVAVMTDTNPADPFDGVNSYHTYHDTMWRNATANDLYMKLQQTHS